MGWRQRKEGGVDPSRLAIEAARERIVGLEVDLELYEGISTNLTFETNSADLVFLGFFLYLVPRNEIDMSVSEINRILKPGGLLAIEDFEKPNKTQNPYKYDSRVVTFKEDYTKYFIESFGYNLVEMHSYCDKFDSFSIDPDERIATKILFKPLSPS